MDDRRVGLAFRALRRRLGWRQRDLSARAGVRQQDVSDIERGHFEQLRLGTLRRVARALDASADVDLQWRGGALDRLIDERHARLVEATSAVLVANGWEVRPEVSFALFGERGSIDILALRTGANAALIAEVKSELTSVEETLRRFDVKLRVGPTVASDLLGSRPGTIGAVLVLPDSSTARRRITEHSVTFAARFPQAGREVREWLRHPVGPLSAVWFLSGVPTVGSKRVGLPPHRIRRPKQLPNMPLRR